MAFSISFSSILRRTIGWNTLGELYTGLFGLEMMININFLKCNSQWLRLIYKLAMLTKFVIHLELFTKILRWFKKIWSGPKVDKLLHFLIVSVISALEKGSHSDWDHEVISLSSQKLIYWSWAELNVRWRACQRWLSSMHRCLLNLMASVAGRFCFLT